MKQVRFCSQISWVLKCETLAIKLGSPSKNSKNNEKDRKKKTRMAIPKLSVLHSSLKRTHKFPGCKVASCAKAGPFWPFFELFTP